MLDGLKTITPLCMPLHTSKANRSTITENTLGLKGKQGTFSFELNMFIIYSEYIAQGAWGMK